MITEFTEGLNILERAYQAQQLGRWSGAGEGGIRRSEALVETARGQALRS